MGVVVPFQEIVRARRRRREREHLRRCVELIEMNLALAWSEFDAALPEERPVHARRAQLLSDLLEYSANVL
jgi:hypothetical protein